MAPDTTTADAVSECEVMGSLDAERFVIADLCADEAWLSVAVGDAAPLDAWR